MAAVTVDKINNTEKNDDKRCLIFSYVTEICNNKLTSDKADIDSQKDNKHKLNPISLINYYSILLW
ncbi:MAG: hypothetical protein AB7V50_06055 [Vampirovibrionia bacterium]